jgi:hypothetical protein
LRSVKVLITIALLLAGCAGRYERGARYAAIAYDVGMTTCDIGQTYAESDGGRWDIMPNPGAHLYEGDPLLGPTPAPGLLATNAVLTSAVTTWIGTKAPTWAAWTYLGIVGVVETAMVFKPTHMQYGGACGVK